MASTTDAIAVGLLPIVGIVGFLALQEGCSASPVGESAIDGAVPPSDAGTDRETRSDSGTPACTSTFVVSADCEHPAVAASCADGWCRVPRGCFVMGSPTCEFGRAAFGEEETETHLTHDFEIGELEVSQAEWTSLGIPNPSGVGVKGDVKDCMQPSCPVGHVTWYAAAEYANRLSVARSLEACYVLRGCRGELGTAAFDCDSAELATSSLYECSGYRLPTDAEWEYVARAGTRGPFFLGGYSDADPSNDCKLEPALASAAWYCFNAALTTHPRGEKQPNAWGVRDILGNAYEWTSDPFITGPRKTKVLVDPGAAWTTPGDRHSLRGGGFSADRTAATVSKRLPLQPGGPSGPGSGFRLARTLSPARADAGQ